MVLLVVWALSGRDYFWPVWPILGFMLFLGWQAFYVWYGPQDPDRPAAGATAEPPSGVVRTMPGDPTGPSPWAGRVLS